MDIVATLVGPLALVGWALLVLVWQLWRRRVRGLPLWLACGAAAVHFWCASPLGANLTVRAVEGNPARQLPCVQTESTGLVVALAGGVTGGSPGEPPLARLKEESFRRTVAAAELALHLPLSHLIVSGGAGQPETEADLMVGLAVALGVPRDRVRPENRSGDTHESAVRVTRIARELGVARVHLVTSALHMPRAAAAFEAQGLHICRHPVDWRQVSVHRGSFLLPQITAMAKTTAAVREILAYGWYQVSGRLTPRRGA